LIGHAGLGSTLLSEAKAKGLYEIIKDWQTLIGIGGALLAAWLAARPVWEQLASLNLQNEQRTHEILIDRSINLHGEKIALSEVFTRVEIVTNLLQPIRQKNWIISAHDYAYLQSAQEILSKAIERYESELGRIWGDVKQNESRRKLLDYAFRFANSFSDLLNAVKGNFHAPVPNAQHHESELIKWGREVVLLVPTLDDQIKKEIQRITEKVANIEKRIVG
jgi:hypothetical protein